MKGEDGDWVRDVLGNLGTQGYCCTVQDKVPTYVLGYLDIRISHVLFVGWSR